MCLHVLVYMYVCARMDVMCVCVHVYVWMCVYVNLCMYAVVYV